MGSHALGCDPSIVGYQPGGQFIWR